MKEKAIYIILAVYAIIATLTILFLEGTGGTGDSIHHYLFAKYAGTHPELFFHHWAKPLYVLVAFPFAQFGFTGVKIFNATALFISIYLTYKVALELEYKNAYLVGIFLICAPLNYALTFSGLTEPLFALMLIAGVYLAIKNKFIYACLLISFLPFVRSEGLIFLGIFCLYLLVKNQWRKIPLLATGHLLYSFAGYFIHHDLLWVFNKIPYATWSSNYGSGPWNSFIIGLNYIIGLPLYVLFWIGIIGYLY